MILCSCEEHDRIFFPQGAKSVLSSIAPIYAACLEFTAVVLIHLKKPLPSKVPTPGKKDGKYLTIYIYIRVERILKNFEMELQEQMKEIEKRKARLEKFAVEANQLATAAIQHKTAEILTHLDSMLFPLLQYWYSTLLN